MWIVDEKGLAVVNFDNVKAIQIIQNGERYSIRATFGKNEDMILATYDNYDEAATELFNIADRLESYFLKNSFGRLLISEKRMEERKKNEHRKDK